MPQAAKYLSDKWDECSAWGQLAGKVNDNSGILSFRDGYCPNENDYEAVDYLCQEWDYGFIAQSGSSEVE